MKTFSFISAALLLASAPIAMAAPAPSLEDASPLLEVRWLSFKNTCKPRKGYSCVLALKRDIDAISIGGPASSNEKRDTSPLASSPQVLEVRVVKLSDPCKPTKKTGCLAARDVQRLVADGRASFLEARLLKEPTEADLLRNQMARWSCQPTRTTVCLH